MSSARLRRQDGFIREILWLVVILAVLAVVVLDGLSLFSVNQSVKGDAERAAEEAHTEYAQTSGPRRRQAGGRAVPHQVDQEAHRLLLRRPASTAAP